MHSVHCTAQCSLYLHETFILPYSQVSFNHIISYRPGYVTSYDSFSLHVRVSGMTSSKDWSAECITRRQIRAVSVLCGVKDIFQFLLSFNGTDITV